MNKESEATGAVRTPIYVSYKSFTTFLQDLKDNGIPPQIDRSALKRFAGGLASQLIMGLKSLGLIDDGKKTLPALVDLAKAFGTPGYKDTLRSVLNRAYPFLKNLDLTTATPSMFAQAFKDISPATEDVLSKSRRFYIHAAQEAGIDIGQRLTKGSASPPRSAGNGGTKRRGTPKKRAAATDDAAPPPPPNTQPINAEDAWLQKFPAFDPSWPDDIKKAWFTGYKDLMDMRKKG